MQEICGQWLKYYKVNENKHEKYGAPAPYFRKKFTITGKVYKAELKIAALGWFKAYLNNEEITLNDEFLTSWTDYNKRIEYLCYDITNKISKNNAIGVVLGNGWACGTVNWGIAKEYYGCFNPCFIAEVILTYIDGRIESISTDDSWLANIGEIVYNDIMGGEYVDARKTLGAFSSAAYDDSLWEKASICDSRSHVLVKQTMPKTRVKELLTLKYLHTFENKRIYTTNQNMAGIIECDIKAKRGAQIIFRYGELLNADGSLYVENLRGAKATDTYICSGDGIEHFRPKFTFHGFQFVEVCADEDVEIFNLQALVIYSDLDRVGSFTTSNPITNKIYENTLWGQKSNFINIPTDCPQRDERLGWLGDAGVFARTANWQMDCKAFWEHFLSVVAESITEEGGIPCLAPIPKGFLIEGIGSSAWSDAFLMILSDHYDFYADRQVLEQYFPYAEKFICWIENHSVDYLRESYCFSDWLSINANLKEGCGDVDFRLFDLCYYAIDCLIMQKFCRILGVDTGKYQDKHMRTKEYFVEYLKQNPEILSQGTQTALLLAYRANLLQQEEISDVLISDIEKNGLTCGFIGTKYLLPVLTELERSDLAYNLATTTQYPSWGYCIENGATTIWERWDSYTKENGVCAHGMNSFNHYAFGSIVEWFYEYVLGIRIEDAGFKKILLKPYIDFSRKITSAKGSYKTSFGVISSSWAYTDSIIELVFEMPEETLYSVELPKMRTISSKLCKKNKDSKMLVIRAIKDETL